MAETYSNRDINQIKNDVRDEFKKIDSFWTRDDLEIYKSWLTVIERYKNQVLNSDKLINKERYITGKDWKPIVFKSGNEYQQAAEKYFTEAHKKILDLYNNVKWWIKFTSDTTDEKIIADVARKIDKAENDALMKIEKYCNPMQQWNNEVYYSSVAKDKQWNIKVDKKWEVITQKPMFNQTPDWTMTFTDRSNPLKIHQVLGGLFNDKKRIYKIDYSNCTNIKIKNKMQNIIWSLSCWIKYDKSSQTYLLNDKTLKILSNRALIWEWVTIKQDTILENKPDHNSLTKDEQESLKNLRSTSEAFEFDANNYRYYEQYSANHKTSICSSYAYWVVSDILAKKWCCFTATEVDAWNIANSSNIKWKFSVNEIDKNNPKQQILNAPAGSFLTVRFKWTSARTSGVSHVMVSLWNGVYTDLFGPRIRKIDFKSETRFSWNTFYHWGKSYAITEDARLISPNIWSFPEWSEQNISRENLTPNDFVEQVHEATWANRNYIRSLIASQNNISEDKFWVKANNLSIKIITKEIRNLELKNKEWSSDVADNFLDSLKNYKTDIMSHYPNLTNNEYDEISKRAIGILYQESNAGDSLKYWWVLWVGWKEWWLPIFWMWISARKGITWWERSRWYTQIKFDQIFSQNDKSFLKKFGITSGADLTNAIKCWIATIIWLIGNYFRSILPMKSDPFRRNDAKIIHITFNDGESEDIAVWKVFKQPDGTIRARTEEEIQAKINEWWKKHWWIIKEPEEITRKWLSTDDDFFNMLYYTRNKPSEISFWTATPNDNIYAKNAKMFVNEHLEDPNNWTSIA